MCVRERRGEGEGEERERERGGRGEGEGEGEGEKERERERERERDRGDVSGRMTARVLRICLIVRLGLDPKPGRSVAGKPISNSTCIHEEWNIRRIV